MSHNMHMNTQPLVSIIMPSYNCAAFIAESIESVLAQSYQNWELLISDDCSTDGTIEVIEGYCAKDDRITFFPAETNGGAAVTRNRSITEAAGQFIAFLDSDDIWLPQKLEKQIAFMMENKIPLSYTRFNTINEDGTHAANAPDLPASIDYNGLLSNQIIGCLTAVYDTEICGKVYMPLIRKRQDFGLWLKILKQGHTAHCHPDVLATYRLRTGSISSNKWSAVHYTWRLYREVEHLSLPRATYCLCAYIARKMMRSRL